MTDSRLIKAMLYAVEKHRGQTAIGGEPYVFHPLRVMGYLMNRKVDLDTLCASVLHDTIEDCAVSYDDLAKEFGVTVANLVAEVSNDNRLPKPQKKQEMIDRMRRVSRSAKDIKLADRIDNLDRIRDWRADKQLRYLDESEKLWNVLAGGDEILHAALAVKIKIIREKLS